MTQPSPFAGLRDLKLPARADVTAGLRDDMADMVDAGAPPALVGSTLLHSLVLLVGRLEHEIVTLTGKSIVPDAEL